MRAVALVVPLLLALTAPADATPQPCSVPSFIGGYTKVDAGVGEYVRVHVRAAAPVTGIVWSAASFHYAATVEHYGYSAERAAAVLFVEDATGAPLGAPGGLLIYPYGVQLTSGDDVLRVAEQDDARCGAAAAGAGYTFAPGDHVVTVLAASDLPNAGAAFLPPGLQILSVQTGAARAIHEGTLACQHKTHAMALGFTSAALVGCAEELVSTGRGYHGVFSGRFPDPTHEVRWDPTNAFSRAVQFFDGGVEPSGSARLLVPKYVTPAGNPFGLPLFTPAALSSDSGVFGVFADVG